MRMPEAGPLGLTVFLPITLAIVRASFLNSSLGGEVETVFTLRTHFLLAAITLYQARLHKHCYLWIGCFYFN